jgi:hypothetical protein
VEATVAVEVAELALLVNLAPRLKLALFLASAGLGVVPDSLLAPLAA